MTNLTLPSDPQSQIPRHTVAEWFQMDGVCSRKGIAVTYSSPGFQSHFCDSKIREIVVDLDCLVLHPSWPLNWPLYLKMWFPHVMMMRFDQYKHKITVKQHWVVYLREMIPLSYAKGGHLINVQGQREGGSREDLSSDFLVSFISSLQQYKCSTFQVVWIHEEEKQVCSRTN